MKLNMNVFLLFFLFHMINNWEEEIECFTSITIWPDENNLYYYQCEKPDLQVERDAYFFLNLLLGV